MEKRDIDAGMACFLVRDSSLLQGWESPIFKWLKDEGFIEWRMAKGIYLGVDCIYININSKVYAPGMPGIKLTSVVADHAITFDEFKIIYKIFKQYDGLGVLIMTDEKRYEKKI